MKHQLPWNVNGIPSDARDAARAAASREGMSVGDWLTRRILAETLENTGTLKPRTEPEATPAGADYPAARPTPPEAQWDAAIRRLEDAVREITHRLDAAERSQEETNRNIGNAAAEITAATQDQSKSFALLARRIEDVQNLARNNTSRDSLRDLHQAVTQLADYVARTVADTKSQSERLAGQFARDSAEAATRTASLAERVDRLTANSDVASIREQVDELGQFMDKRFGSLNERVNQAEMRLASARRLEERLQNLQERIDATEATGRNSGGLEDRITLAEQRLDRELKDLSAFDGRIKDNIASLEARIHSAEDSLAQALTRQAASLANVEESLKALGARVHASENTALDGSVKDGLASLETRIHSAEESLAQLTRQAGSVVTLEETLLALEARVHTSETAVQETLARQTEHTQAALAAHTSARTALEQAFAQLDARMNSSEKSLQEALDRQSRSGSRIEDAIVTLESAMKASETRVNDSVRRHLDSIERNLGAIVSRLEHTEQSVANRMEASEKSNRDALAGLRSQIGQASEQIETLAAAGRTADRKEDATPPPPGIDLIPPNPFGARAGGVLDFGQLVPAPATAELPTLSPLSGLDGGLETFGTVQSSARDVDPLMPPAVAVPPEARDYLTQARRAARAAEEAARRDPKNPPQQQPAMAGPRTAKESPTGKSIAGGLLLTLTGALVLAGGYWLVRSGLPQSEVVALAPTGSVALEPSLDLNESASPPADSFGTGTEGASALIAPVEPAAEAPPAPAPQRTARAAPPRAAPSTLIPAPKPLSPPPALTPLQQLTRKAESGDAKAALVLGIKYADGDGVAVNDAEALRWLRMAAEAGEAVAQYRLGTFYEKGRATAADLPAAAMWYLESAKLGNRKAMHNLAVAYADGAGIEKNFSEAARWFKNAADLGLTDSQFNLAVLYERGLGVQASLSEAYKWYAIAMGSGDAEARTRVEALATQLPAAEKIEADRTVKDFKARAMELASNDPPPLANVIP